MEEQQIRYLCEVVSSLPNPQSSRSLTLLRSYYLMKCKEITSDCNMFQDKFFSPKVRCSRCCTEWRRETPTTPETASHPVRRGKGKAPPPFLNLKKYRVKIVNQNVDMIAAALGSEKAKVLFLFHAFTACETVSCFNGRGKILEAWSAFPQVHPIKLSKRQRKRIKSLQARVDKKKNFYVRNRLQLLYGKEMELLCHFCKQSTVRPIRKPKQIPKDNEIKEEKIVSATPSKQKSIVKTEAASHKESQKKQKKTQNKVDEINMYSPAKDVFSLSQKNNTLAASIKEEPKVIKNNKKKKDKFAGLCAKAVLATAKLKEEKEKQNKLNLFLKPSSDGK